MKHNIAPLICPQLLGKGSGCIIDSLVDHTIVADQITSP